MAFCDEKWFSSEEDAEDYADRLGVPRETLPLWLGEPICLHVLDAEDVWDDELCEGSEVPDEVQSAVNALNEVIAKQGPTGFYRGTSRMILQPRIER
jgi:hypothetical protein